MRSIGGNCCYLTLNLLRLATLAGLVSSGKAWLLIPFMSINTFGFLIAIQKGLVSYSGSWLTLTIN